MHRHTTHRARLLALALMIALALLVGCACSAAPAAAVPPAATAGHTAQDDRILIVTGEYNPYVTSKPENQGFMTEIVRAAAAEAGMDIRIEFYPWERCRQMVHQGQAWASYPFEPSPSNDDVFSYSEPVYPAIQKFYYLASNPAVTEKTKTFTRIGDFRGFTFGGASGYWYGTPSDFIKAGVSVEWSGDTDGLFKMLRAGRIDFFMEDHLVAQEAIHRLFLDEESHFATLPHDAENAQYCLITSKDDPDSRALMQRFDAALDKLRHSGEYDRILAHNGIARDTEKK